MRLDYVLYVVAALLFIITAVSSILLVENVRSLSVVTTVVLGIMFVGLGYYMRPKAAPQVCQPAVPIPQATTPQTQPAATVEPVPAENTQAIMEAPATPLMTEAPTPIMEVPVTNEMPMAVEAPAPASTAADLTRVKGIGEKRATQLKALGINSIDDLAKASAKEVAAQLQISPKFVQKWIAGAKELVNA